MTIEDKIDQLEASFNQYSDWEDRYKELIKIGKNLDDISDELKVEKFIIKGCQSQVWLVPELKDGQVNFIASSDAILVKGIIGILVNIYSGSKPEEIMEHKGDFLKKIGITEHLSMNRTNGLASMVKQIQMYAFVYKSLVDKGIMNANNI